MKALALSAMWLGLAWAAVISAGGQTYPAGLHPPPDAPQKPSAAVPLTALPANNPTSPSPPQQQLTSTTTVAAVRRAQVDYAGGLLTVKADNSSLNQILGSIARLTGIKITGGVADDRVFGTYGPSDLPTILAVLLDGTGSNMMLSGDRPGEPQVLTLTPRQGGVTPPSPSLADSSDDAAFGRDQTPQQTPRSSNQPYANVLPGNAPPPPGFTPPTPTPQQEQQQQQVPPASQPTAAASDPAATTGTTTGTTTDQSPNGVKTPQQIYDQLMKLQSQQPKAPQ